MEIECYICTFEEIAIVSSSSLSSLSSSPFSTLVVNRSKPFLKKSKPFYLSHTNPPGRRRADRPHRIGQRQASKSLSFHVARISHAAPCQPSLGLDLRSFRKDFRTFIDSLCFYCVRFLPRFILDLPTLSIPHLPLDLVFLVRHSPQRSSPSSPLRSPSRTSQHFSKFSFVSDTAAYPLQCRAACCQLDFHLFVLVFHRHPLIL